MGLWRELIWWLFHMCNFYLFLFLNWPSIFYFFIVSWFDRLKRCKLKWLYIYRLFCYFYFYHFIINVAIHFIRDFCYLLIFACDFTGNNFNIYELAFVESYGGAVHLSKTALYITYYYIEIVLLWSKKERKSLVFYVWCVCVCVLVFWWLILVSHLCFFLLSLCCYWCFWILLLLMLPIHSISFAKRIFHWQKYTDSEKNQKANIRKEIEFIVLLVFLLEIYEPINDLFYLMFFSSFIW